MNGILNKLLKADGVRVLEGRAEPEQLLKSEDLLSLMADDLDESTLTYGVVDLGLLVNTSIARAHVVVDHMNGQDVQLVDFEPDDLEPRNEGRCQRARATTEALRGRDIPLLLWPRVVTPHLHMERYSTNDPRRGAMADQRMAFITRHGTGLRRPHHIRGRYSVDARSTHQAPGGSTMS
ncbi:MAG: hypothetical protein ABIR39_14260 [Nocardioides sp.]|uniref:hypothetical protein n=1 Tax=Nocardioides sp. TaxID=35761 RepID=UPI0032649A0F